MDPEITGALFFFYGMGALVTFIWAMESDSPRFDNMAVTVCTSVLWPLVLLRHLPRLVWETLR